MTAEKFIDNREKKQYELHIESHISFTEYRVDETEKVIALLHTNVPRELAGRGVAGRMVEMALSDIKKRGYKVNPICTYVKGYMEKNTKWQSLHF